MSSHNVKLGRVLLPILFSLTVMVWPAAAQQEQAPPSAAPSDPKAPDPKGQTAAQDPVPDKDKSGATLGKSKLEKETGTVNDRIFEVLPNYGTVENANELPPISSGQKFRLATAGVFDWASYPFNGALSAIDQAKNEPRSWG